MSVIVFDDISSPTLMLAVAVACPKSSHKDTVQKSELP